MPRSTTGTATKKKTKRKVKKNLVIVESPSKAKTIEKYLGSRYKVMASLGHIRDLPKSKMGVDVENNYEPHYISIRGKGDVIKELRKEAKKAAHVYLAADPDREGEAIAWEEKGLIRCRTGSLMVIPKIAHRGSKNREENLMIKFKEFQPEPTEASLF